MDIKDIVERLERHEAAMNFARIAFGNEENLKDLEALHKGVELLKKYIPVEVSTNDFDSPLCPSCKKMFHVFYHPYCSNCGQALDWKNFEAEKKRKTMMYLVGH